MRHTTLKNKKIYLTNKNSWTEEDSVRVFKPFLWTIYFTNVFSRAPTADVARNIVLLAIDPRSAETSCENKNKRGSVSGVYFL